jgi:hypothetical protein
MEEGDCAARWRSTAVGWRPGGEEEEPIDGVLLGVGREKEE